jgi:hypothetical protein
MFSLEKSPNFINEYNTFQQNIQQIDDETTKKELLNLLGQLKQKVKLFDMQHGNLSNNNRISPISLETKEDLLNLRRLIDKKLNQWKKDNAR